MTQRLMTANLPRAVMPHFERTLSRKVDPKRDWFISIHSPGYWPISTPLEGRNTLYESFYDVPSIDDPHPIQVEQGKRIADFIKEVKAKEGNLWVNCHAGISRSGAIVEIALQLGFKDLEHPIQATRYPNPLVYRSVKYNFPELMPVGPEYEQVKRAWEEAFDF